MRPNQPYFDDLIYYDVFIYMHLVSRCDHHHKYDLSRKNDPLLRWVLTINLTVTTGRGVRQHSGADLFQIK